MARQPTRRRLTGRLRRNNKRRVSSYRRAMHLSHAQVGFRHLLQNFMVHDGSAARSTLYMLTPLLLLTFIIHNNVTNPTDVNLAATAISFLLRVQYAHHVFKRDRFLRWLRHDQILHDIPLEEEEAAEPHRMPRQDVRFDSWSSQECMDNTSFKKNQLRTIYNHFGLAHLAAQNGGFIRIPTGWFRDYHFHPEELFLFFMTKCKLGISNRLLCDKFFGGHQSRWSFGYPWILHYLDNRYQHQLGNEALHRFVPEFPKFYNAFNKFAKKTSRRHHNDGSSSDRIGLNFIPFRIFGLIDCSIFRINRPFSGPDGDYIGAPRKENYPIAQRAVYTGYKKCHGIKVQTILLPNGISCLYGPTSARVPDIGPTGILEMSGLDHFLQQVQQNNNTPYYAFGDGVYNSNALRRIRSYFRSYGGIPLSPGQELCNRRMKTIREEIERSYADVENIFQICSHPKNFRLGKRNPYAQQQLRVCFLLSNIYTCLNGCKASGYTKFNCRPPTLAWYLSTE